MEFLEDKEIVVIFQKRMGLETLVSKLGQLNGEQIKKFFWIEQLKFQEK